MCMNIMNIDNTDDGNDGDNDDDDYVYDINDDDRYNMICNVSIEHSCPCDSIGLAS